MDLAKNLAQPQFTIIDIPFGKQKRIKKREVKGNTFDDVEGKKNLRAKSKGCLELYK